MTYSVQLYDQVTDRKLEIIHINNTIDLDDNDDNFTELFEQELLDPKLKETKYNISPRSPSFSVTLVGRKPIMDAWSDFVKKELLLTPQFFNLEVAQR